MSLRSEEGCYAYRINHRGSGFVGRATAHYFRNAGWQVIGVGRRPLTEPDYLQIDLCHPSAVDRLTQYANVDVIIHAAARSSPWGSKRTFLAANVQATQNLLDLAKSLSHPKFVFISSSSVYYEPRDQLQITESTPFANPALNHYAHSKQLAESCVRTYPGPWCILRPRAVYGRGDTVLFPRILKAAQAGKLPWIIRQGDPARGDLISIKNLTACIYQAATEKTIVGEYNLTDNQPVAINAFLSDVFERLSIAPPRKQISVGFAFRVAYLLECLYGTFLPRIEPPITRFGVHVFAYSKVFDVSKMIHSFGQPQHTVTESVNDFIQWVKDEHPYDCPS